MGYKILVVDDIAVNRAIVRLALETIKDVEFIDAADGVEALEVLAEQEINLVVLDLMMPIKDGFEVLKEMKNTPGLWDIPVIVYSANEDVESVSEALELGAYDYFTKPLKPREMKVILPMKAKNAIKSYDQQKIIQELNFKLQVDLLMANILQQSLLNEKEEMAKAMMYGKYIPAREIGGDFYDCMEIDDTVWFIMADVSADGVAAAMLSTMLKMEFQHCIRRLSSPDQVLQFMDQTFSKITKNEYTLTAVVGMIQNNVLSYANAGQPYPLLFSAAQKKMEVLRTDDGSSADEKYKLHKINIASGDVIVTYNQGLIEDKVMSDSLGVYDDLANCFLSYRHVIDEDVVEFFTIMFRLFGNGANKEISDDMAMMLIAIK